MASALETPVVDAAIIGGGPAGATCGRLLAEWGYAVVIVHRESRQPSLAETLPPSANRLFRLLEIDRRIEDAGFFRTTGNTAWWGSEDPRAEFYPEPGYQVLRSDLDRLLLYAARQAGATVLSDSVQHIDDADSALLRTRSGVGIHARFALDCSGRAGLIARAINLPADLPNGNRGLRIGQTGYATVALSGIWTHAKPWPIADQSHTLIESYQDGWAWSVPLSVSRRFVTTMLNMRETKTVRGDGLLATYRTELAKTRAFQTMLRSSQLDRQPWACDASLYHAASYSGPSFLLIGDAGSSVDPLSSFGVKKAMASAWLGAVVVNTCLRTPRMAPVALDYFNDRERQVYADHLRQTAALFREVASREPGPFWAKRAEAPVETEFCTERELAEALDCIKRSPSIRLDRTGHIREEQAARVRGREIVLEKTLVARGLPEFVRGVHLPKLIEISGQFNQVPDLYAAYNRTNQPVALPNFLGALSMLLASRALENNVGR